MKIEKLKKIDETKWDQYVVSHKLSTIYHFISYRRVVECAFGHRPIYLLAKNGNRIVGVLPLFIIKSRIFKNCLISLPFCNYGGPLSDNQEIEQALIEKAKNIVVREELNFFETRSEAKIKSNLIDRTDKGSVIISLPKSESQLWSQIGTNRRTCIRKGRINNLRVTLEKTSVNFYKVYSENQRNLGSPVISNQYFSEFLKAFPSNSGVLTASNEDSILSSVFFAVHPNKTLEITYAGTSRLGRTKTATVFLYWEALRYCLSNGYKVFDFGRSTLNSNSYFFKLRWKTAKPKKLHYQQFINPRDNRFQPVVLSPANKKYRLGIKLWQKLPLPLANWVGPYLSRELP